MTEGLEPKRPVFQGKYQTMLPTIKLNIVFRFRGSEVRILPSAPITRREAFVQAQPNFLMYGQRRRLGASLGVGVEGTLHEHCRALFHRHGGGEPAANGCNRLV